MEPSGKAERMVIRRHALTTRVTHWIWVVCLFFLLLSGLQIFMARPDLYIGHQSGFGFDNTVFAIGATMDGDVMRGHVEVLGRRFDTTGWLGAIEENGRWQAKSFPGWMTIPSYRDLASGRVVHFFFAWILAVTLAFWLLASLVNRHLSRDILPRGGDLRALPCDIAEHARFRIRSRARYGALQKFSYFAVMFVLLPLMVLSGLTMSPGMNAWAPWMVDLFGGRQTARTAHFAVMLLLVAFFAIHIAMVILAGPFNELRSMITGRLRVEEKDVR